MEAGRIKKSFDKPDVDNNNQTRQLIRETKPESQDNESSKTVFTTNIEELKFKSSQMEFSIRQRTASLSVQTPAVRQDVVDRHVEGALNRGASYLAGVMEDPSVTRAEKNAIISGIVRSGDPNTNYALTGFQRAEDAQTWNRELRAVSEGLRSAFEGGHITQTDLNNLVSNLGVSAAEELIINAASNGSATGSNGLVEALGRAAEESGFDRAAALAFTSSPELIRRNLTDQNEVLAAFEHLTSYISERDERSEVKNQYGEVSIRTVNQLNTAATNAARLLTSHGETIIGSKLDGADSVRGEAELVKLFQGTLFSPYTNSRVREMMTNAIERYANSQLDSRGFDASGAGRDVGTLLAITQIAAREAIAAAGSEAQDLSAVNNAISSFSGNVAGGLASAGLIAMFTNPVTGTVGALGTVASVLGGAAVEQIIGDVIGQALPSPPTQEELETAFRQFLEQNGADINAGEVTNRAMNEIQDALLNALNEELSQTSDADERARIQEAINLTEQFLGSSNDGYQNTTISGEDGLLRDELNSMQ